MHGSRVPTASQQVRVQNTSCTFPVHLRSGNSHLMAKLGYLHWVLMLHHRVSYIMSCNHSAYRRIPEVQFKVARPVSCALLPYPSPTSQHDFLILHTIKVVKERELHGSFALRNGLGDASNLSNVPLNAVHVTMQLLYKRLKMLVILDLGRG